MGKTNGTAVVRGLALFALGPVKLAVFVAHVIGLAATMVGLVFVLQPVAEYSRWLPNLARRLAGRWSGTPIASPYRPRPASPTPDANGLYRSPDGESYDTSPTKVAFLQWSRWIFHDPATWRDFAWFLVDPIVGGLLAILPTALIGGGAWLAVARHDAVGVVVGVVAVVAGLAAAPFLLRLHGAWTALLLRPTSAAALARGQARRRWARAGLEAAGRCFTLGLLSLAAAPMFVVCAVALAFPGAPRVLRRLPNLARQRVREWSDRDLPAPYQALPPLRDPATWRDLLWMAVQPVVGLTALVPAGMVVYGGLGLVVQALINPNHVDWVGELFGSMWLALVGGVALVLGGLAVSRPLLRAQLWWLSLLLRPVPGAGPVVERLEARVERLTETRAAATDTQAAEVRRIERDLHDGAQARLVAMGMTLGAIEALIDSDPEAAKRLLARAKDSSASALTELRGLIRGIHPPVLAERGLVDAIRALALDSPLQVQVNAMLDGRPSAPVESAVYFAVAETLTNAARHANAGRVWIDMRRNDGILRVSVLDDGDGGADPDRGSGLRGIERRLSSFDGSVTVSSPVGGPTMVTMELPCVLSSPKTSTSSETA